MTQSASASSVHLGCLCHIVKVLTYERNGSVFVPKFPNLNDKYTFTLKVDFLCEIFVFAYHVESFSKDSPQLLHEQLFKSTLILNQC